jgi:hypothetical protein
MNRLLPLLLAALPGAFAWPARADRLPPPEVKAAVYATRVDGMVEIGPDGRVARYAPVTVLAEPLAGRVRTLAEGFRFEPVLVDGRPVIARTRMRMHLVAEPIADGELRVAVEHIGFPDDEEDSGRTLPPDRYVRGVAARTPVHYPRNALRSGISGRVLVALRLAPDGSVVDAHPRESALFSARGHRKALAGALALLERAATDTVRRWRFDVRVPDAARPAPADLTALVAVQYLMSDHPHPRPGVWLHESRSRERSPPWLDPLLADRLPDMADVGDRGHFGAAPNRFRLLTPPAGAL